MKEFVGSFPDTEISCKTQGVHVVLRRKVLLQWKAAKDMSSNRTNLEGFMGRMKLCNVAKSQVKKLKTSSQFLIPKKIMYNN